MVSSCHCIDKKGKVQHYWNVLDSEREGRRGIIPGPSLLPGKSVTAIVWHQTNMLRSASRPQQAILSAEIYLDGFDHGKKTFNFGVLLQKKNFLNDLGVSGRVGRGSAKNNTQDDPLHFILRGHSEPFECTWAVYYLLYEHNLRHIWTTVISLQTAAERHVLQPVCIQ